MYIQIGPFLWNIFHIQPTHIGPAERIMDLLQTLRYPDCRHSAGRSKAHHLHCTQGHPWLHPWAHLSLYPWAPRTLGSATIVYTPFSVYPAGSHNCTRTGRVLFASIFSLNRTAHKPTCKVHFTSFPLWSSLRFTHLKTNLYIQTHILSSTIHTQIHSFTMTHRQTQKHTISHYHTDKHTHSLLLSLNLSLISISQSAFE